MDMRIITGFCEWLTEAALKFELVPGRDYHVRGLDLHVRMNTLYQRWPDHPSHISAVSFGKFLAAQSFIKAQNEHRRTTYKEITVRAGEIAVRTHEHNSTNWTTWATGDPTCPRILDDIVRGYHHRIEDYVNHRISVYARFNLPVHHIASNKEV